MSLWRTIALLSVVGVTMFCSRAAYLPEQVVPTEKALLWKIGGKNLKRPSYLFGTIHLIPRERFCLTEQQRQALGKVGRLVLEIDLRQMDGAALFRIMTKTFMSGGKTLRDVLTEEDYAFVREQIARQIPLPLSTLERMKPMFLSSMLQSETTQLGESGRMTSVEIELLRQAKKQDLAVEGLETVDYQISLFDSIPYTLQAQMLVEQLRRQSDIEGEFADMISLYEAKDLQGMEMKMREMFGDDRIFQEILVDRRNREWIPVMERMMREKPTFFAVGAGHLGGASGVIALLRRRGYRVEAVE